MTLAATAAGHGFLSPTGVEIAFVLVGIATLGAALVTVTTRQLVHAALWLVVALGGIAVEYLLLTAEFIAWVQVLIYVGSVVVLLLFGLMLTKAPIGRSPDADSGNRWAALAVALASAGRPGLGRRGRLPRHLDQPRRAPPRAPPRSPGAASSSTGCCPSRRCPCCCWPRSSGRSCCPAGRGGQGRGGGPHERCLPHSRRPRPARGAALMHLAYPAVLAVLLFCIGLYGVLARRNAILVLMSVELMLNAVNLNLVAFDVWLRDTLHAGQALTLFTIAIAAAEIGIGLAIVLLVYRNRGSSDIDRLRDLAETTGRRGRGPAAGHHGGGRRVTLTTTAVLVPLLPFLGAVAGLLLGRRAPGFVRPLAVLPTLAAAALDRDRRRRTGHRPGHRRRHPAHPDRLGPHRPGPAPRRLRRADRRPGRGRGDLRADLLHRLSARRSALPLLRRAGLALHLRDAAGRLHRRPDGAAGRLGSHGHLLLLPRRPLLGDRGRPRRLPQGLPRHQARRRPLPVRHLRAGRRRRDLPDHRHPRLRRQRRPGPPDADRAAAAGRCRGQVGAVPAAHLAAGRDGRPDARSRR